MQDLFAFVRDVGAPWAFIFWVSYLAVMYIGRPLTASHIGLIKNIQETQASITAALKEFAANQKQANAIQEQQVRIMDSQVFGTERLCEAVANLACSHNPQPAGQPK